jgi:hypothetical protein
MICKSLGRPAAARRSHSRQAFASAAYPALINAYRVKVASRSQQ